MAKTFLVTIAWDMLREHLAREHGRQLASEEIVQWLKDAGFQQRGERWLVQEKDLGALDPSEVTAVDEVDP